jgi:hypothetical protein
VPKLRVPLAVRAVVRGAVRIVLQIMSALRLIVPLTVRAGVGERARIMLVLILRVPPAASIAP